MRCPNAFHIVDIPHELFRVESGVKEMPFIRRIAREVIKAYLLGTEDPKESADLSESVTEQ